MVVNQRRLKLDRTVKYGWPGDGKSCGRKGYLWRGCPSLKHAVRYKDSCHRRDCPDHWRDWLAEESGAAADRINIAKSLYKGIWQHVIVSFKGGGLGELQSDRERDMERVRWVLRFVGLTGGAIVCHPARVHTKVQYDAHPGDDDAHFHGLCRGWVDPERVTALNIWYGVVVKGFGRDRKSVYGRIEYMLSHAALPTAYINPANIEGSTPLHALTYWGVLAYNNTEINKKLREIVKDCLCPGCNVRYPLSQWHLLECLDEPPDKDWVDLTIKNAYGRPVFEPKGYWGEM